MHATILGCGYVGIKLAEQLQQNGHEVTGVRRSQAGLRVLKKHGVTPLQADITEEQSLSYLPESDWVIFMPTPDKRTPQATKDLHVKGLQSVIETYASRSSPPKRLIYASTTGVYGDHDGRWVNEDTPVDPPTKRLAMYREAEQLIETVAPQRGIDGTVIRFAGLYGPERYRLGRYLEGPVVEGYLNMIHRSDAAGVITKLLCDQLLVNDVAIGVDTEPVHRWEFADWLADLHGKERPEKQSVEEYLAGKSYTKARKQRIKASKRCANKRLKEIEYKYRVPTYREGYKPTVESNNS